MSKSTWGWCKQIEQFHFAGISKCVCLHWRHASSHMRLKNQKPHIFQQKYINSYLIQNWSNSFANSASLSSAFSSLRHAIMKLQKRIKALHPSGKQNVNGGSPHLKIALAARLKRQMLSSRLDCWRQISLPASRLPACDGPDAGSLRLQPSLALK